MVIKVEAIVSTAKLVSINVELTFTIVMDGRRGA